MSTQTQKALQNGYQALLMEYAAGMLDEAQNLAVASHLTYSANGRKLVHDCEAIGGALIESECEPVAMRSTALDNVLAKLDSCCEETSTPCTTKRTDTLISFDIPEPLQETLATQRKTKWKKLFPGMKAYDLKLDCKQSTARFMQARPGLKSPHHHHQGMEITLVLDGAFSDETGSYKRGDLIVTDDTLEHTPVACKMYGCTCLVVSTAPIKLSGIASLLNPFLKP